MTKDITFPFRLPLPITRGFELKKSPGFYFYPIFPKRQILLSTGVAVELTWEGTEGDISMLYIPKAHPLDFFAK